MQISSLRVRLLLASLCLLVLSVNSSAIHAQANEIPTSPQDITPLLLDNKVPDVQVVNTNDESVSLREICEGQATLLIFYRGNW